MTSEHGNFPLFGTKGEQVIVILYTYLNNVAEFFILHYINMGIFLSLDDLLSKFPFVDFYFHADFALKRLKSTAVPSEHGKIPLFRLCC